MRRCELDSNGFFRMVRPRVQRSDEPWRNLPRKRKKAMKKRVARALNFAVTKALRHACEPLPPLPHVPCTLPGYRFAGRALTLGPGVSLSNRPVRLMLRDDIDGY